MRIVVGSRYWSPTVPTNTLTSIISGILTQQVSQRGALPLPHVELDHDNRGGISCTAPLLLVVIWYARSMVCGRDGADGGGAILKILTKIRYLLDTLMVHFRVIR